MIGYPEGYGFNYIALVRKSDGKEVYSSPLCWVDAPELIDLQRIKKNLNFYFDRVNFRSPAAVGITQDFARAESELEAAGKE